MPPGALALAHSTRRRQPKRRKLRRHWNSDNGNTRECIECINSEWRTTQTLEKRAQHDDRKNKRESKTGQITSDSQADYNGFLKITWPHRAVRLATEKRTLNYAQGGGQKGRQANHIILQKEMKYEYVRLRRQNFATMDNDAKVCYDRIIMLLATIIS